MKRKVISQKQERIDYVAPPDSVFCIDSVVCFFLDTSTINASNTCIYQQNWNKNSRILLKIHYQYTHYTPVICNHYGEGSGIDGLSCREGNHFLILPQLYLHGEGLRAGTLIISVFPQGGAYTRALKNYNLLPSYSPLVGGGVVVTYDWCISIIVS